MAKDGMSKERLVTIKEGTRTPDEVLADAKRMGEIRPEGYKRDLPQTPMGSSDRPRTTAKGSKLRS